MKLLKYILCLLSLCMSVALSAVETYQIPIPWQCGFEFEDDNTPTYWTLNAKTSNALDQWVIGNALSSEGKHSLYISADSGSTAVHAAAADIVMAYRTIKFPETPYGKIAHYNISFDCRTLGTASTGLYVYIGLKSFLQTNFLIDKKGVPHGLLEYVNENSGMISDAVLSKFYPITDGVNVYKSLSGVKKWTNFSIVGDVNNIDAGVSINNKNSKEEWILAFIWVNNSSKSTTPVMGACIDNIQIASANVKRPYQLSANVNCEDSTIIVTWKTTLAFHAVEYKKSSSQQWTHGFSGLIATDDTIQTCIIPYREEGSYDIRVRGASASQRDTSGYACISNLLVWCPDNHCINYVNLNSPDVVCTYGRVGSGGMEAPPVWDSIGVVDYGEESIMSQHTINWMEDRYDPCTLNSVDMYGRPVPGLKTIPDGALASVRLGNWDDGYGYESITYTYEVDSFSQAILVMKYAILLEKPGHSGEPGFRLQVLDENGKLVHPTCGVTNFIYSSADASSWFTAPPQKIDGESIDSIRWKDWTTVGLNLAPYHGRKLHIKLETGDCGASGHFGYAYFTLDCISASLTTDNCGASSSIAINAPEGFTYTWTDSKGEIVGHDRILEAKNGHEVYTCTACMIEGDGCCFDLSTTMDPRYPIPSYTYEWNPRNCQSVLAFVNTSHVMLREESGDRHTSEPCEMVTWTFQNHAGEIVRSPLANPVYGANGEIDSYGDTIIVTMRAQIGGGICDSVRVDTIFVPSIYSKDSVINAEICEGDSYIFGRKAYDQSGTYYDVRPNVAGCDSTSILNLIVHERSMPSFVVDTVCSCDMPYNFGGYTFIESGDYKFNAKNQWGCDSTVYLSLSVVEKLKVDVDPIPDILCAGEGSLLIHYSPTEGEFDSLLITFESQSEEMRYFRKLKVTDNWFTNIEFPYTIGVIPDHYKVNMDFYQHHSCGNQHFDMAFDMEYSSSIITQKWNDVLTVLAPAYNGNYTFTNYQWYKDGVAIPGATSSYLYQPLMVGSEYQVELTRASDGVKMISCPLVATLHEDIYPFPKLMTTNQLIAFHRDAPVTVRFYTILGQLYSEKCSPTGEGYIIAPAEVGTYILEWQEEGGERNAQQVLVVH